MESGEEAVRVIPQVPVVPESAVTPVTVKVRVSSTVAETRTASMGATETSTVSMATPEAEGSSS